MVARGSLAITIRGLGAEFKILERLVKKNRLFPAIFRKTQR